MNARPPARVVSLVPSFTETLRAWGRDPMACTRYCEQPDLPTVGGTKNPDVGAIVALEPDLVLLDRDENRVEDARALEAAGIALFVSDVHRLDDVAATLSALADVLDVAHAPPTFGPLRADRPRRRAFVPIWRRPWMAIGPDTYGSDLLASLGIDNVLGPPPGPDAVRDLSLAYRQVSLAEVARAEPDLVIAPSEPYEFSSAHLAELAAVAPVIEVDGQDLFWWGIRTPRARERLAATIDRGLEDVGGTLTGTR